MPTTSAQARIDASMQRLDHVIEQRLRREEQALAAENADQLRANAQQAREDAERRRMIVSKFDDAFAAFSTETPQARDDEAPGDYRRRLFERLRRRLPDSHELAQIRADELPSGQAYLNFERMIIDAAKAEGERPSIDNLPPSGELISRIRTDEDSGAKATHWYGRESFIKQLSRPAQQVLRLIDPATRSVLHRRAVFASGLMARGGHVARHVGGKGWTPLALRGDNRGVIRSDMRGDTAPPAPTPAHGSPGASAPLPPDKDRR